MATTWVFGCKASIVVAGAFELFCLQRPAGFEAYEGPVLYNNSTSWCTAGLCQTVPKPVNMLCKISGTNCSGTASHWACKLAVWQVLKAAIHTHMAPGAIPSQMASRGFSTYKQDKVQYSTGSQMHDGQVSCTHNSSTCQVTGQAAICDAFVTG